VLGVLTLICGCDDCCGITSLGFHLALYDLELLSFFVIPHDILAHLVIFIISSNKEKTIHVVGPTLPRVFSSGGYTNNVDGFFLVGGYNENDQMRKDVMRYDEETQQFKIVEGQMETERGYTAAIITSTDQC
jgi:hypothetical protein